ncbi:unnamed protein product [Brassicogethes aeneus]|uniref:Uncharacterized protein n=1 Tax=Brassicogethes aeneus TaxID=1431903 RepID=A0A9P0FPZ0_BRAAE|nr:unnamed protein product [Brassicogethes aeneus]
MRLGAKERGADIYPSYHLIAEAKKKCYPANIKVTENEAEVPLLDLLIHTSQRLAQVQAGVILQNMSENCNTIEVYYKWGLEGSGGHSIYKQNVASNLEYADSNIILCTIVPLQMSQFNGNNQKIYWKNSTPSSTRYCRPIGFKIQKENAQNVKEMYNGIHILEMEPTLIVLGNREIKFKHIPICTMLDGKTVNILTDTASSQACNICKATPKDFNNLEKQQNKVCAEDNYKYICNFFVFLASSSSGQELLIQQSSFSMSEMSLSITLPTINEALALLDQSPVSAKRRIFETYLDNKVTRVAQNLRKALGVKNHMNTEFSDADATEIINSLREKFNDDDTSRSIRVQILTLLPLSWSVHKVMKVMGASEHMVRVAKTLVAADGILSVPTKKTGRELSSAVVSTVTNFYNDDEMSSIMPGKKDFISVRNDNGTKVQCQKRLVLCNLKELHKTFNSRHPEVKIGFSSFASLRPKHCILAGGCGTHTVCVCSIHQNIKLMILGVENVKQHLLTLMENNEIDEVNYKQWVSTPRETLETTIKNTDDFVDDFGEKLKALLPHNFIAKEQAAYLRRLKECLKEDEFIVIVDFAENYSFVVQDAAPGFHWNNDQATVYTVVIYYKKNNELTHRKVILKFPDWTSAEFEKTGRNWFRLGSQRSGNQPSQKQKRNAETANNSATTSNAETNKNRLTAEYHNELPKCTKDIFSSHHIEKKLLQTFKNQIKIITIKHKKIVKTYQGHILEDQEFTELENTDIIERAALILRQQILNMDPDRIPDEMTADDLIKGESTTPKAVHIFYKTLLSGASRRRKESSKCKRIVESLADNSIYAVSNGKIKPSKHITLGMALKSLTSSKKVVNLVNKFGHCCSYTVIEELETEATFVSTSRTQICPADITKTPNLLTGVAFDNFDRFVDTLTGKDTLHDTVGIIFQNIDIDATNAEGPIVVSNIVESNNDEPSTSNNKAKRKRRTFDAITEELQPYNKQAKMIETLLPENKEFRHSIPDCMESSQRIYLAWMASHALKISNTPMWVGFNSLIYWDNSPTQKVSYLTPTEKSVVYKTMVLTQKIAEECKEYYMQVTYDLAIAREALRIQARERPQFDNLFIHLGSFHVMMAYFKAVGKFIDNCGSSNIMVDCGLLASGSVNAFIIGKHFNRLKYHDNLLKIDETHPGLSIALQNGSFGVKRTPKPFSRQPIDLTLEQTIYADAPNKLTGIINNTNSISARQRWCKSHSIRSTIISHVLQKTGLKNTQDVTAD